MTLSLPSSIGSFSVPRPSVRAWSERVQGALMIGVLALGAWQGAAALSAPAAHRRLAGVMDGPSILAGRTAAAINYVEAHYLPADGLLRAGGGIFRWALFRSGGPQVTVGCNDWLYLTEELRPWPDAEAHMQARAATLGRIAAALAAKNIGLVVALVPDKARIERRTLCGAPRSAQAEARYAAFMGLMQQHSIQAVDLAAPFEAMRKDRQVYYRTDTHWNQDGAALAASLVGKAALAAVPGLDQQGYGFETRHADAITTGPGDMLRLMSLDHVADGAVKLRPSPDLQALDETVQTSAPADSGGLLDDGPGGQVVLLGSSYSLNANFQGRLQQALKAPVGNFAEAGGGFASAARTYFKGGAFADHAPKLVVWEIPERVVGQPLDAADRALAEGW